MSSTADRVEALIVDGRSKAEAARLCGVSAARVTHICRARGLPYGITPAGRRAVSEACIATNARRQDRRWAQAKMRGAT